MQWRIGTIGFSYAEWAGAFYPRAVGGAARLGWYARHFNAVELDTTFYAIPSVQTVERWRDSTPEGFRFALKMPKAVTHEAPLESPEARAHAAAFLEVVGRLGAKLAVVLLQFPPQFVANQRPALAGLLADLPRVDGVRYAVELRHDSWWAGEATADLLREQGVCWVSADEPDRTVVDKPAATPGLRYYPRKLVVTADFLYVRWIGRRDQFAYSGEEQVDPTARLRWWSEGLERVAAAHPAIGSVWGLAANDYAGHAPATAQRVQRLLGMETPEPDAGEMEQGSLFG